MTLALRFDYDDYVRGFRAACARHGIDPAQGATGYQVVHIAAERRRADWTPSRWWQQHEFWTDCPPYRSETEQDALWQVFSEAYLLTIRRVVRARRLRRAELALRELHQYQNRSSN